MTHSPTLRARCSPDDCSPLPSCPGADRVHIIARRADDWEDWEDESFEPKLTPVGAPAAATAPLVAAVKQPLAAAEPEEDKFAGEDEGEDEPAYKAHIPEPQQVSPGCAMR